jgi:DNA recombination protein RmuC
MLVALIILQALTLIALLFVLLRRPASSASAPDPALQQLLSADLPTKMTRFDTRFEGVERNLREGVTLLRGETSTASSDLRKEVLATINQLTTTLRKDIEGFRSDNASASERLAGKVEDGLKALNERNEVKLEQMRETVDEKLQKTLHDRLTKNFGEVTDQLIKVHAGLGEMTKLSAGVDDLSRIFTNVKLRGGFGERVVLEMLLKDRLAPSQYVQNARVKPNSQEAVEFAVKFPTPNGETLLPIDSKFPLDKFEALQSARDSGLDATGAGKAFEAAIRSEAKKICDKYICPPNTTAFAILFLPTESLYAEVIQRDGLQNDIQRNCHVTIAGPSTLSALLTSFQMGFHMLQLQQKGDEVWKVLANAQKQFGNLGVLMSKMESQVNTVQNTIGEVGKRTRVITKALSDIHVDPADHTLPLAVQTGFDGLLPALAATEDEE